LEGGNDFEFLTRLAIRLRLEDHTIPDLQQLVVAGHVVVLSAAGSSPDEFAQRLAPLRLPQFHLYDRGQEPETQFRLAALEAVNALPGCQGALLTKRALENYLHQQAIAAAGGGGLEVADHAWIGRRMAQACCQQLRGMGPGANYRLARRTAASTAPSGGSTARPSSK
jgi:hypothetical protein